MITYKLPDQPSFTEQAAVLVIKRCKEVGVLLMLKQYIRKQHKYGCCRAYSDIDAFEIIVPGVDPGTLSKVMKRFSRSFYNGGHGGYPISFDIQERELDMEEIVRNEERCLLKQEITQHQEKVASIELRLSQERKRHLNEQRLLTSDLKLSRQKLRSLEREHQQRSASLMMKLDSMQDRLQELEAPLLTIIIRRLKQRFRKTASS